MYSITSILFETNRRGVSGIYKITFLPIGLFSYYGSSRVAPLVYNIYVTPPGGMMRDTKEGVG